MSEVAVPAVGARSTLEHLAELGLPLRQFALAGSEQLRGAVRVRTRVSLPAAVLREERTEEHDLFAAPLGWGERLGASGLEGHKRVTQDLLPSDLVLEPAAARKGPRAGRCEVDQLDADAPVEQLVDGGRVVGVAGDQDDAWGSLRPFFVQAVHLPVHVLHNPPVDDLRLRGGAIHQGHSGLKEKNFGVLHGRVVDFLGVVVRADAVPRDAEVVQDVLGHDARMYLLGGLPGRGRDG
mmetsp:Transcript_37603/g.119835  ORF Transcript_37603/g.119835 Transcript_37603/m.119835 type:complete len:237 (+) Transcript_37603:224-934(+)